MISASGMPAWRFSSTIRLMRFEGSATVLDRRHRDGVWASGVELSISLQNEKVTPGSEKNCRMM